MGGQWGRGPRHVNGASPPWSKADQHRFEDKLDDRLKGIEDSIDRLDRRQAWIAGGIALALVVLGVALRLMGAGV